MGGTGGETDGGMDQGTGRGTGRDTGRGTRRGKGRDTGPGTTGSWTASNAPYLQIQPMVQCYTAREVLKVKQPIVVIVGLNFLGTIQEPV